jgi:hypothetical protein
VSTGQAIKERAQALHSRGTVPQPRTGVPGGMCDMGGMM